MARFHISPDGQARACTAKKVCKYGEDVPHFSTAEDARTAYEASQKGSFSTATLTKKAADTEKTFTFEGAVLDSRYWLYNAGNISWGKSAPSVSFVADGIEYSPTRAWGEWSAERLKEDRDGEGWSSMKPTKAFIKFEDLARHVEGVAFTQAKRKLKNPDLTYEEAQAHFHAERQRYDALDAEIEAEQE